MTNILKRNVNLGEVADWGGLRLILANQHDRPKSWKNRWSYISIAYLTHFQLFMMRRAEVVAGRNTPHINESKGWR